MEGSPPSLSAYARGGRQLFIGLPGPAASDYDVKCNSIVPRTETVAPFDTSANAHPDSIASGPGPVYYPVKKNHRQYGSPLFRWGPRFPDEIVDPCIPEPFWGRIPDPWVLMTDKIKNMQSMRPRVSYDKYVSNNVPSVYHPLNIRSFVVGIDGRMYPWTMNRNKMASASDYNTYKIYTSQSKITPNVNFSGMAARKDLFPPVIGAGPAGYVVRKGGNDPKGGIFLGKSSLEKDSSSLRMFDIIERQTEREHIPSPSCVNIEGSFERCSQKVVLAPFKSKTKLGFVKPKDGPGPAAHFLEEMYETDLKTRLEPGVITYPPEKAPFETSQRRFANFEEFEEIYRPAPNEYDILSFTELMKEDLKKHAPAIVNPKLGFLTSSEARPVPKDVGETAVDGINIVTQPLCRCLYEPDRKWRNLRPKRGQTYGYNGAPAKFPDSPGPIYDTAPGIAALKAKKTWWDPRRPTKNGFLNSGCGRKTDYVMDMDIPGPGKYYPRLPRCCREPGTQSCPGPRFQDIPSLGPGPTHKFHEMAESSVWRASHLGTFNSYLKHVGVLFPWAGGFHKKNLNQAGDEAWRITRIDEYENALCPSKAHEKPRIKERPATLTPCGNEYHCRKKRSRRRKHRHRRHRTSSSKSKSKHHGHHGTSSKSKSKHAVKSKSHNSVRVKKSRHGKHNIT